MSCYYYNYCCPNDQVTIWTSGPMNSHVSLWNPQSSSSVNQTWTRTCESQSGFAVTWFRLMTDRRVEAPRKEGGKEVRKEVGGRDGVKHGLKSAQSCCRFSPDSLLLLHLLPLPLLHLSNGPSHGSL